MASLVRRGPISLGRCIALTRPLSSGSAITKKGELNQLPEKVTHTGQKFDIDDYRRARFIGKSKLVNENFAIDLIAEDPVVVCTDRVVSSDSGGPLGHPKVFINLDPPGIHTCGYSGRKFVLKKYYNEKEMGHSITYDEYLEEIRSAPKHYPC